MIDSPPVYIMYMFKKSFRLISCTAEEKVFLIYVIPLSCLHDAFRNYITCLSSSSQSSCWWRLQWWNKNAYIARINPRETMLHAAVRTKRMFAFSVFTVPQHFNIVKVITVTLRHSWFPKNIICLII